MMLALLPLALATQQYIPTSGEAGLSAGPLTLAAWRGPAVLLRPPDQPGAPGFWVALPGEPLDAVQWQGALILLLRYADVQALVRVNPNNGSWAAVLGPEQPAAIAVDRETGALLVADAAGAVTAIPLLVRDGDRWRPPDAPDAEPQTLELTPVRMLHEPTVGIIAATEAGLTVLNMQGGSRRIHGLMPLQVEDLAVIGPGRVLTLGRLDGHPVIARWSLLHPEVPWPFPIGITPLDQPGPGLLEVPGGAWVPAAVPLYEPSEVPGLVVGLPDPSTPILAAAALETGASPLAVLLREDMSLQLIPLPLPTRGGFSPLGDAQRLRARDWSGWAASLEPPGTRAAILAQRLREDDLPLGLEMIPGGSLPEWARQAVEGFIRDANTFNRLPLIVAESYLERFPDGNEALRRQLEERKAELRTRTATAWGVLVLVGSGLTWAYRSVRRRLALRDQALALGHNPFRQDSPNNPERTPFAANSLSDDLLHTLELNFAVVEGPQFSGKSALLRHVAWRLEHEGISGREAKVVRLDLFGVPEERFWTVLGRATAKLFPEHPAAQEVLELDTLDRGAVEYLLDEALTDDGPRLVFVLDDLDALGMYQREAQKFRGLLQVIPSHRLSVLGAGFNIRRGFAGTEDESPWFNLFQVRQLRPLSREDLVRYLDSRLVPPFSFHPEVPGRLLGLTEGRPLQIWHLCFAAVEAMLVERRLEMTPAHIEAARGELRTLAGVFQSETDHAEALPSDRQKAWEMMIRRVAEARRVRDNLLQELRERRVAAQADGTRDFFEEEL